MSLPKLLSYRSSHSGRIIDCYMANEDYPEELKLEIIHAIDYQPIGIDE